MFNRSTDAFDKLEECKAVVNSRMLEAGLVLGINAVPGKSMRVRTCKLCGVVMQVTLRDRRPSGWDTGQ